jgi:hypothetical protein
MPIDFNQPTVGQLHNTEYTPGIRDALRALGKQLDGETISNPQVGTICWSTASSVWQRFDGTSWNELATGFLKASQYTAADVLAKLLTVDGTGSGLDAALLGGAGPAFFTDIPARLGYTPLNKAGDSLNGRLVQHANGFGCAMRDDLTARVDSGFYESSSASLAEGWPLNAAWMHLLSVTHSNTSNYYAMQLAGDFYTQRWFLRNTNAAGGQAWAEVWHSGNFNPFAVAPINSPNFTGTPLRGGVEIGFRSVPRVATGGGTLIADNAGRCVASSGGLTVPSGVFAAGDAVSLYNDSGAAITLTQGAGLTLRLAGTGTTGNRTLAARGLATLWFNSAAEAIISGSGLS